MFRLLLTDDEYEWLRRTSCAEQRDMSSYVRARVFPRHRVPASAKHGDANDRCAP